MPRQVFLARWKQVTDRLGRLVFTPDIGSLDGWAVIDLRPDQSVAAGLCLIASLDGTAVPGPQPGRSLVSLGTADPGGTGDSVGLAARRAIEIALGITLAGASTRALLRAILFDNAKTDGTRWRPLTPTAGPNGVRSRYEVWLGNEMVDQVPFVGGGAFVREDWDTKADGFDVNDKVSWLPTNGALQVVSHELRGTHTDFTTDEITTQNPMASTDDNWFEIDITKMDYGNLAASAYHYAGVVCRVSQSGPYLGYQMECGYYDTGPSSGESKLSIVQGGTTTNLARNSVAPVVPLTLQIRANGSTLTGSGNGTIVVSDSNITTGKQGSLWIFTSNDGTTHVAVTAARGGDINATVPLTPVARARALAQLGITPGPVSVALQPVNRSRGINPLAIVEGAAPFLLGAIQRRLGRSSRIVTGTAREDGGARAAGRDENRAVGQDGSEK